MLISCCCQERVDVITAGCTATYHCVKCGKPAKTSFVINLDCEVPDGSGSDRQAQGRADC